jgi:hypothetical protein
MFAAAFDITFAYVRDFTGELAGQRPETIAVLGKSRPDKENQRG